MLLSRKVQNHELTGPALEDVRAKFQPALKKILSGPRSDPLWPDALVLAASCKDPVALDAVRATVANIKETDGQRGEALGALIAVNDAAAIDTAAEILGRLADNSAALRSVVLAALGRSRDPRVASIVLENYSHFEPELKPRAIEVLTQRPVWAKALLTAIGEKKIPAEALNVNQVQRLLASHDRELVELVTAKWGSVRTDRNPQREKVVAQVRELLKHEHGDARAGQVVFKRVCGQCHRIYGEGQDVGPEITANGRASFEQLLSNVLDPSLVIGVGYQARIVQTTGGRTLTGLLAEDNPQRIVLKMQGGKTETIPRAELDSITVSKLSLMPEGLEKQLAQRELIDLFEFLLWGQTARRSNSQAPARGAAREIRSLMQRREPRIHFAQAGILLRRRGNFADFDGT